MNSYEKILKLMRSEGSKQNSPTLQKAEMTSSNTCKVGDLSLDADDLLIMDHIENLKSGDIVIVYRIDDDFYIVLGRLVV